MGLFERFPYTNFHELNAAWIIEKVKELDAAWKDFSAGNKLSFADPLLYDMSKSYAKNTIVLDANGNAYVALKAVPAGVGLSNTEYWLMVFDYEAFLEKVNKNFTGRYYRDENRAKTAMSVGEWLTFDDVLCKVTAAIAVDDLLEDGVNIEHFTLEDFIKAFMLSANQLIQQYKNDIDGSELLYRQQLAQDIADTTATLQAQLDAAISGVTVDSEVINARIGANGTTYPTLGDAIRTQITETEDKAMADSIRAINMLTAIPTPYSGALSTISADATADKTKPYKVNVPANPNHNRIMIWNGVEWIYDDDFYNTDSSFKFFGSSKVIIDIANDRYTAPADVSVWNNQSRPISNIATVSNQSLGIGSVATNGVLFYLDTTDLTIKTAATSGSALPYSKDNIICGYYHKVTGAHIFLFPYIMQEEVDAQDLATLMDTGRSLISTAVKQVNNYNTHGGMLSFAFITDPHMNGISGYTVRSENNMKLFKDAANNKQLSFAFMNGDFISCYGLTKNQYVGEVMSYADYLSGYDIPLYVAKGNHDGNVNSTSTAAEVATNGLTRAQYYQLYQTQLPKRVVDEHNPFGGYYYVDFPEYMCRVIVLNDFESPRENDEIYHSDNQCEWLYDTLNDIESGWNVLIISHYITSHTLNTGAIIDAFAHKGTTVTATDSGISYTFDAGANGTLIGHIYGHIHSDAYDNTYGWNRIGVAAGYADESDFDTTDEFCFDIFTISTYDNTLYEQRIGKGSSRSFSF